MVVTVAARLKLIGIVYNLEEFQSALKYLMTVIGWDNLSAMTVMGLIQMVALIVELLIQDITALKELLELLMFVLQYVVYPQIDSHQDQDNVMISIIYLLTDVIPIAMLRKDILARTQELLKMSALLLVEIPMIFMFIPAMMVIHLVLMDVVLLVKLNRDFSV